MPELSAGKHGDLPDEVYQRALNKLKAFQKETESFRAKYEELLRDHPGKWVAILNQDIIGIEADRGKLIDHLKKEDKPLRDVYIEHVTDEEPDTFRVTIS